MYTTDLSLMGQRAKVLRESRGLTVEEVSAKSGVAAAGITAFEAGRDIIGIRQLGMIVEAMTGSLAAIEELMAG